MDWIARYCILDRELNKDMERGWRESLARKWKFDFDFLTEFH
jgi:hypothetical protein